MFYIYNFYSESANKYYIGYTNDPVRRLIEHNTTDEIKFTTKYRPWKMLVSLEVSDSRELDFELLEDKIIGNSALLNKKVIWFYPAWKIRGVSF